MEIFALPGMNLPSYADMDAIVQQMICVYLEGYLSVRLVFDPKPKPIRRTGAGSLQTSFVRVIDSARRASVPCSCGYRAREASPQGFHGPELRVPWHRYFLVGTNFSGREGSFWSPLLKVRWGRPYSLRA